MIKRQVYQKSNSSMLSDEQQEYVVKISKLFKEGKIKGYTLDETKETRSSRAGPR